MRRVVLARALLVLLVLLGAPAARADGWHSEQPPAPAGSAVGAPVPIGAVGDIEFWAPNRGLLTTAGNDAVPAGLYGYDGTGWYQLSTVCGGHGGRIAWAGPNEWWTIADQPVGQAFDGPPFIAWHLSLCHFVDGKVVASYAEPIGTPNSYEQMDAATCAAPDDCWFAGDRLPGTTNVGAFHLHWDGTTLTAVPSLTTSQPQLSDPPRAIGSLASHQGHLYESARIASDDVAPDESPDQPYLLHEIVPASSNPFLPLFADGGVDFAGAKPWDLSALQLSSDGTQLWAVAGAIGGSQAHVTALRLGASGFQQVCTAQPPGGPCTLTDPSGVLGLGTAIDGVAAEPGTDDAWVAFTQPGDGTSSPARLTRIHADATVDAPVLLPGPGDGIGRKGGAGPIACPTSSQCWMATTQGWLFHLGDQLPQDADPAFHQLITFRPPDDSIPFVAPDSLPIDDSGANPPPDQIALPSASLPPRVRKVLALVFGIRRRIVHGTTLELSFSLRAKAHVQLVATRRKRVVAHTKRYTLDRGAHRLRLRLDPRRWPTGLDLRASAIRARTRK